MPARSQSPSQRKMTAVDTAWLRMDRPHNRMVICGVLILDRPVEAARMAAVLGARFASFERFRSMPVEGASGATWREDPRFAIARHLVHHVLPRGAGRRELARFVSSRVHAPLPADRPAWQFTLVDNVDGGSALVARIHHSYADGIALVRVMLGMTDVDIDGPPAMPLAARAKGRRAAPDADRLSAALERAMTIGAAIVDKGAELWSDPSKAAALASQGGAIATELAHLALMGQDAATRFKGKPGIRKCVAWADPLPLDEVKTVGRANGASINDVVMSSVAGALSMYLRDKGEDVAGKTIRALVPVNLRDPERAGDLGNEFGLVFVDLPLGLDNPIERLAVVRATMEALKKSYQPVLALGILAAMGVGPRVLQDALLTLLARNASAVLTNVPGPQRALYIAGARIDDLMFWVPQSGDIGLGLSVISYDGGVQFGVITDHGFAPDPERIVAHFADAFEALTLTTLIAPWPRAHALDPAVARRVVETAVCAGA
jgi:diacylglycerol O-acyltransferase / wax synthase